MLVGARSRTTGNSAPTGTNRARSSRRGSSLATRALAVTALVLRTIVGVRPSRGTKTRPGTGKRGVETLLVKIGGLRVVDAVGPSMIGVRRNRVLVRTGIVVIDGTITGRLASTIGLAIAAAETATATIRGAETLRRTTRSGIIARIAGLGLGLCIGSHLLLGGPLIATHRMKEVGDVEMVHQICNQGIGRLELVAPSNRGAEIKGLLQLIVSEGLDSVVVRQVTETVGNLLEGVIMDIHGHIRWLARTAKKVCPKGIDFRNRQLGFKDCSNQPFETRLIEVGAIKQGLECIMKLVRYETCGNTGKVGATGSKGLWMTGDLDLVNKMEDPQEEI